MRTLWLGLRAALFYLGYGILTAWYSLTGLLFARWFPYDLRTPYMLTWNNATLFWLWLCCGVRVRVRGSENWPQGRPCVIVGKHQSQWETFFLQIAHPPTATVLKRELLAIPFFGWGLRLMEPIAIDRSNPKQALRQIQEQGMDRIARGRNVLIFPEGTRTPVGKTGNYGRSGAELACRAGVPLVPVAHNAGVCWPARSFLKYPGTIEVVIGKPIETDGADSRQLTEQVKAWIEGEVAAMPTTPGAPCRGPQTP